MSQLNIVRGTDKTWRVTVYDANGARQLLDAAAEAAERVTAIEFEVRTAPDATGDALISKVLAAGITIDTQTGVTKGQFTLSLLPADTASLTASSGSVKYYYDIFMVMDGKRLCLVGPSLFNLSGSVNIPPA